jgi:tetratricopeptide (TPR) repeat protein
VALENQGNIAIPVTAEEFQQRRRKVLMLCGAVVAVFAVAGYLTYSHYMDPIHARDAYDDAKRLAGNTRYSQAILACSRAIALRPQFTEAYLLRARAYSAQGYLEQAESDYAHVVQIQPDSAPGYSGLCEVYFNYKNYKNAIDQCSKAIQLDPTISMAFNLRGASLRETAEPVKSLADLNRAVELSPTIDNLYQRGATLRALKKYKEAIADFDQAAFLFPGNPEVYRARAETKRAMGDERGAREDYKIGKSIEAR